MSELTQDALKARFRTTPSPGFFVGPSAAQAEGAAP